MANKKNWIGKVQKDVGGYKVRQLGAERTVRSAGGKDTSHFTPNGKFGVFAGRKKLVKGDFTSVDEAVEYAKTL